jgi:DNA topoisomerase VI subunit A
MASGGGQQHGIPTDPAERQRIRQRLSDDEKNEWDALINKIAGGGAPDRDQKKFIRKLKADGKITLPSKRFRDRDRKTHRDD